MHEYSLVRSLLDRVECEAAAHGAVAVHRIRLRVGELAGVESELLRAAYDVFRQRSVCDSAELVVSEVEARWVCSACGEPLSRGGPLQCALCGAAARLAEGDEIVIEQIEMEVH